MADTTNTTKLSKADTLTKREAAKLAGVTPRTIARWLADPDVPLTRYLIQINRVAVSRKELRELIRGRSATPSAE